MTEGEKATTSTGREKPRDREGRKEEKRGKEGVAAAWLGSEGNKGGRRREGGKKEERAFYRPCTTHNVVALAWGQTSAHNINSSVALTNESCVTEHA